MITALSGGLPRGMTVSSLSVLAVVPPTVAFAVRTGGSMHEILIRANGFAVSLLADDQEFTARFFASRRRPTGWDQFVRISSHPGIFSGAPLLTGALGWLDCRTMSLVPLGTHQLVIGLAVQDISVARDASGPLLYGDRRYHRRPDQPSTDPRRHGGRGLAVDRDDAERG